MISFTGKAIFWFRRDLRLQDNVGLQHALESGYPVVPLFLLDPSLCIVQGANHPRNTFLYDTLLRLQQELVQLGSNLIVVKESAESFFAKCTPTEVYANNRYEPHEHQEDLQITSLLQQKQIKLKLYKDQVVFHHDEVMKTDGMSYVKFTPYREAWKKRFQQAPVLSVGTLPNKTSLDTSVASIPFPTSEALGIKRNTLIDATPPNIGALDIGSYEVHRDYPAKAATTKVSVHLRYGTISIRELVRYAMKHNDTYLNELIWREFFTMILWQHPRVVDQSFHRKYERIAWNNNKIDFEQWCAGTTGYPIVDAGMRELNTTGIMHNRVRMIVASFLVKHLLIDWRWGEGYFAEKLLDYDLAANNGNWQWVAGTGCDSAPYFRIFNPMAQTDKFDGEHLYIKKWVPEYTDPGYQPMVDHKMARERAIMAYKVTLQKK